MMEHNKDSSYQTDATVRNIKQDTVRTVRNIKQDTVRTVRNIKQDTARTVRNIKQDTVRTVRNIKQDTVRTVRNIKQDTVRTVNFVNIQIPCRAVASSSPFSMSPRQLQQKLKTTSQAVAIDKSTGARTITKKVLLTRRNDYIQKTDDADLQKLLLQDRQCNKLSPSINDNKRSRQQQVEVRKELEEAKQYYKELISRKVTKEQEINSLKKTIGRGAPVRTPREDILLHQMLVDQERIQRGRIKLLEIELSALTGSPLWSKSKLQKPKPQHLENDSLPPVRVPENKSTTKRSEKVKSLDGVCDLEKQLGKQEFDVPAVCAPRIPRLDLNKPFDDSLPDLSLPAICGPKGKKKRVAVGQKRTKHHDRKSRTVALPDIRDNSKIKLFIPNDL